MIGTTKELIWQGRLHMGDEPGTFGDANYVGMGVKLPLTLYKHADGPGTVTLYLEAENVECFDEYPGHKVTVYRYKHGENERTWTETVLTTASLKRDHLEIKVDLSGLPETTLYLGISVEVDMALSPGLYGEFVLRRVLMFAPNYQYFASFGFQYAWLP